MKFSFTLKLTFAFICLTLLSVGLASVFTRYFTEREFTRLTIERAQSSFMTTARDYYREKKTWAGFDEVARRTDQAQRNLPNNPPPRNVPNNPPLSAAPPPTVLTDLNNLAVTTAGRFRQGMVVPSSEVLAVVPLELDGVEIGRVMLLNEALERNPQEQQFLARTDQALLYAAIAALAVACVLGFLLARVLTYPLRDLTLAIRAMQRGELNQEVKQESNDEVGEVVQAFNQMSRDLAHANQLRRQMTADIAHDLRSPLTVISGYTEMMRDGTVEPNRERFDLMFAEAQRLQNLVEDLRTLSLADAGELKLHFGDHSSAELLQAVALAYQPLALQRHVTLSVSVENDLPLVRMDHGRMMQVFNNLVSNALHYTPAGGSITLKAERTNGGVRWIVEDTGVGIPPDKLPHIFERSYRVDAARQDGGSGLGLAIARSIVEAHQGLIEAVSEVGRGTRMIIALPS